MSVGMPFCLYLHQFGEYILAAFGHTAYHVGSSLSEEKSAWRDVDVRVMLPDAEYEAQGYGKVSEYQQNCHHNQKWVATVLAWSAFGKQLTGLPIDFQIQPLSWANANEGRQSGRSRGALFDLALAYSNTEFADRTRKRERERIVDLIGQHRHISDDQLAEFVMTPQEWE